MYGYTFFLFFLLTKERTAVFLFNDAFQHFTNLPQSTSFYLNSTFFFFYFCVSSVMCGFFFVMFNVWRKCIKSNWMNDIDFRVGCTQLFSFCSFTYIMLYWMCLLFIWWFLECSRALLQLLHTKWIAKSQRQNRGKRKKEMERGKEETEIELQGVQRTFG